MNNLHYRSDLPYPSMDDIKPNLHDARIIMSDYAGLVSELTAITQYTYHHLYAEHNNASEVGEAFMKISIVEMHHLDILGNLILKLGGDPKFLSKNQQPQFWTGKYVNYVNDSLQSMIVANIEGEAEAINAYARHAKIVSQPAVAKVLERIILDERIHIKILNGLLENL